MVRIVGFILALAIITILVFAGAAMIQTAKRMWTPAETPAACYRFAPQPDITAWELAQIYAKTPYVGKVCEHEDQPIPAALKRHFERL